jgi:MoxR-like ATPase
VTDQVEDPKVVSERIIDNVEKVIVGKHQEVRLAVIALLCRGHMLIEDVPGVGKTILARSIACSTGCTFRRMQFTPDLLPSDITGVSIYNQKSGDFEFRAGPIMAQVVLADEINRATPKTQSALLEAMEERQVTVDGVTHAVPQPFTVMATQNPIEYEGTFPLPEAQLDRFLLACTWVTHPRPTVRDGPAAKPPNRDLGNVMEAAGSERATSRPRSTGPAHQAVHRGHRATRPSPFAWESRGSLFIAPPGAALLTAATSSPPT